MTIENNLDDIFQRAYPCNCGSYVEVVSSPIDTIRTCGNCGGIEKRDYERWKEEYETPKKNICPFSTDIKLRSQKK